MNYIESLIQIRPKKCFKKIYLQPIKIIIFEYKVFLFCIKSMLLVKAVIIHRFIWIRFRLRFDGIKIRLILFLSRSSSINVCVLQSLTHSLTYFKVFLFFLCPPTIFYIFLMYPPPSIMFQFSGNKTDKLSAMHVSFK